MSLLMDWKWKIAISMNVSTRCNQSINYGFGCALQSTIARQSECGVALHKQTDTRIVSAHEYIAK